MDHVRREIIHHIAEVLSHTLSLGLLLGRIKAKRRYNTNHKCLYSVWSVAVQNVAGRPCGGEDFFARESWLVIRYLFSRISILRSIYGGGNFKGCLSIYSFLVDILCIVVLTLQSHSYILQCGIDIVISPIHLEPRTSCPGSSHHKYHAYQYTVHHYCPVTLTWDTFEICISTILVNLTP